MASPCRAHPETVCRERVLLSGPGSLFSESSSLLWLISFLGSTPRQWPLEKGCEVIFWTSSVPSTHDCDGHPQSGAWGVDSRAAAPGTHRRFASCEVPGSALLSVWPLCSGTTSCGSGTQVSCSVFLTRHPPTHSPRSRGVSLTALLVVHTSVSKANASSWFALLAGPPDAKT